MLHSYKNELLSDDFFSFYAFSYLYEFLMTMHMYHFNKF